MPSIWRMSHQRKWRGRTLSPSHNSWLQTPSEVIAKSTTRVWWSKGTHVWLDGTWFERNDRPGWFPVTAFYAPPVAAILWCQFLCPRSIKWSPVSGVPLRFPASLSLSLMGSVLRFLRSHGRSCMVIALDVYPKRYWWPLIQSCASKSCRLAIKGVAGALLLPSKQGWIPHPGIPGDLWAFGVRY